MSKAFHVHTHILCNARIKGSIVTFSRDPYDLSRWLVIKHMFISTYVSRIDLLRPLVWVFAVCICPTKRTLCLYGLSVLSTSTRCNLFGKTSEYGQDNATITDHRRKGDYFSDCSRSQLLSLCSVVFSIHRERYYYSGTFGESESRSSS